MIRWIFFIELPSSTTFNYICSLRNWDFVGEGWIGVCNEGVCEVLELSGARGILAVVEIRCLAFDSAIIDTGLHLSSLALYSSIFSIIKWTLKSFCKFEVCITIMKAVLALLTRICSPTVKRCLLLFIFLLKWLWNTFQFTAKRIISKSF